MAIAAHAHQDVGQQAAWIGSAGKHRAHQLTHEIAHGVVHLGCAALAVRRRGQHHAVGRRRRLHGCGSSAKSAAWSARRRANRPSVPTSQKRMEMREHWAQDPARTCVCLPEAGVDVTQRSALLNFFQLGPNTRVLLVRGTVAEQIGQQQFGLLGLLRISGFGPEDDAGVAIWKALAVVLTAPQQMIEHGGVYANAACSDTGALSP